MIVLCVRALHDTNPVVIVAYGAVLAVLLMALSPE